MEWRPLWPYHQVIWEDHSTYCRYDQKLIRIILPRRCFLEMLVFSFILCFKTVGKTGLTPPLWFQSTSMAYGKVTEDTVYTCTGHPLRSDIANILDWSLNKDFTTAYKRIPHPATYIFTSVFHIQVFYPAAFSIFWNVNQCLQKKTASITLINITHDLHDLIWSFQIWLAQLFKM